MTPDVERSIEKRLHAALNEVAESVTYDQQAAMWPDDDSARRRARGPRDFAMAGIAVVLAIGIAVAVKAAQSSGDVRPHAPASHATPTPSDHERATQPIDSIRIDAIGLRTQVGEGLDRSTLDLGPGHDPSSGLPGTGRTIVIFGHRTTHTNPFFRLNEIAPGTTVVLTNHTAERFTYVVIATVVADPADVARIERRYDGDLVLVTNTPLYSTRQRLVVVARPSAPKDQ